jgi:hypothetical protein
MRHNESAILELHFFIIHHAAVKSANINAFFESLSTNENYFKKWCDAVTSAHKTPISYDILKNLTEEEVKINYHANSSYPLSKKLSEIHTILYKTKSITDCLPKLDYLNHHEFYKDISKIKVEDRYLTHVDLIEYDAQSLEEMVGKNVYSAPLNAQEDPEKELSRLNFPLMRKFIKHFNYFEQQISIASLASYLHVKPETLKTHPQRFKDKDNADKSLDFDTLITCDLKTIETQFIKTEKSNKKKTAEAIAQAEPANKSSAQK